MSVFESQELGPLSLEPVFELTLLTTNRSFDYVDLFPQLLNLSLPYFLHIFLSYLVWILKVKLELSLGMRDDYCLLFHQLILAFSRLLLLISKVYQLLILSIVLLLHVLDFNPHVLKFYIKE